MGKKIWVVTNAGNILYASDKKEKVENFVNNEKEKNFDEAREDLGFDELNEKKSYEAEYQADYDNGEFEIHPIDKDKLVRDKTVKLGDDEYSFDEILDKFDEEDDDGISFVGESDPPLL